MSEVEAARERRKFGTDTPHEPTDEFVVQAFAEGARSLWPDSRDPGWHVTFKRWLDARDKRLIAWAADRCCTCHTAEPPHEDWCVAVGVLMVLELAAPTQPDPDRDEAAGVRG